MANTTTAPSTIPLSHHQAAIAAQQQASSVINQQQAVRCTFCQSTQFKIVSLDYFKCLSCGIPSTSLRDRFNVGKKVASYGKEVASYGKKVASNNKQGSSLNPAVECQQDKPETTHNDNINTHIQPRDT